MLDSIRSGLADMQAGLSKRHIWLALAKEDIDDQHRNTLLGPIWLLLNYMAYVAAFSFLVRSGNSQTFYAAYTAIGLVVWLYFMELISHSVNVFFREEGFIKGTPLPISIYILRLSAQCIMRSGYTMVGCFFIIIFSGIVPGYEWGLSLVGISLIVLVTPAVSVLFAMLGVLLPDARYIVSNAMRLGMFLSPVFWSISTQEGLRQMFYWYNPFTYFLEMVRAPILSHIEAGVFFIFGLAMVIVIWIAALATLGAFRRKVPYLL